MYLLQRLNTLLLQKLSLYEGPTACNVQRIERLAQHQIAAPVVEPVIRGIRSNPPQAKWPSHTELHLQNFHYYYKKH